MILAEEGHSLIAAAVGHIGRGDADARAQAAAAKGQVRPGRLPLQAMSDTFAYTVRLAWRLRRLHPDIVHTNSLKAGIYGSIARAWPAGHWSGTCAIGIDTDYLRACRPPDPPLTRYFADVVIINSRGDEQHALASASDRWSSPR